MSCQHLWMPPNSDIALKCNACWSCNENTRSDITGRCYSDFMEADMTFSLTLTYRNNADGTYPTQANKRHIKGLINRLNMNAKRSGAWSFTYYVAFEQAPDTKRAHYHMLFFTKGASPSLALNEEKWEWEGFWDHGFTFATIANAEHIGYVTKYVAKFLVDNDAIPFHSYSRSPLLGSQTLTQHAKKLVDYGVMPKEPVLTFREPTFGSKATRFFMQGATKRKFITQVYDGLTAKQGYPPEINDFCEPVIGKLLKQRFDDATTPAQRLDLNLRDLRSIRGLVDGVPFKSQEGAAIHFMPNELGIISTDEAGRKVAIHFSEGVNFPRWDRQRILHDLDDVSEALSGNFEWTEKDKL